MLGVPRQISAQNQPQELYPRMNVKFALSAPVWLYLPRGPPWRILRPCRTLNKTLMTTFAMLEGILQDVPVGAVAEKGTLSAKNSWDGCLKYSMCNAQ